MVVKDPRRILRRYWKHEKEQRIICTALTDAAVQTGPWGTGHKMTFQTSPKA